MRAPAWTMCPAPERPEGPGRTGPSGTGGMEHRMARTPLGDFVSTPTRGPETTPRKIFFCVPAWVEVNYGAQQRQARIPPGRRAQARAELAGEGLAREQEGPADGEPTPDSLVAGEPAPTTPDALTHGEVEARAELARHLQPSVFPADRAALLDSARRGGASGELVERLEELPEGTFDHLEAVWEALGGRVEYRA
ncbi:MAG: DUF2795 domain-containing protein [Actinobacteria bacterium]|nr:MAG: DUF2795 domain-containing protein [Actinomycetota bacterium]